MKLRPATEEFVSYLTSERGLAAATVDAYARSIRRYVAALEQRGLREVAEIRPADVHATLGPEGRSPSYYVTLVAAVRLFHRLAVREGWATHDPARAIPSPRRTTSLPRPLRVDQVRALIESVEQSTPIGLRDRAVLELLYASGLRASEVVGLDVADVDHDSRTMRVLGKGGKERVVPFGRPAAHALDRYIAAGRSALARTPTDALFLNRRGGARLSREYVWHIVKRYAEQAVLANVWPHRLRHSTATHMIGPGRRADLRAVQELLGHARLSTTQIYVQATPERLRWVIDNHHPRGEVALASEKGDDANEGRP